LEDTSDSCAAKIEPEIFITTGEEVISYNVSSGAATRLQDLITPRHYHGCSTVMDSNNGFKGVLVAGGYNTDSGDARGESEMYDIKTGRWSSTGKLLTVREGLRLVVLGDNILAMGGIGTSSVEKFNMTSNTWEKTEYLLEIRHRHAVVAVPPNLVGFGQD